ncbi:MAG: hypothetical protein MJ240_07745, partial [Kiritimatiellae bacterium]|nr:hypothetical protein [Kiritimatiellia bacterium]
AEDFPKSTADFFTCPSDFSGSPCGLFLCVLELLLPELVAALRFASGLLRLEDFVDSGPEFCVGSDLRHDGISFHDG